MSSAPGSQEAGYKPDTDQSASLASTIKNTFGGSGSSGSTKTAGSGGVFGGNQNTASAGTSTAPQHNATSTAQDRRRSSVEGYSGILNSKASGAHTHEHADNTHAKPGFIGSLFSSYVKGGK